MFHLPRRLLGSGHGRLILDHHPARYVVPASLVSFLRLPANGANCDFVPPTPAGLSPCVRVAIRSVLPWATPLETCDRPSAWGNGLLPARRDSRSPPRFVTMRLTVMPPQHVPSAIHQGLSCTSCSRTSMYLSCLFPDWMLTSNPAAVAHPAYIRRSTLSLQDRGWLFPSNILERVDQKLVLCHV